MKLSTMIDHDGYRPNVGIILYNQYNKVLLARRHGENAWQFPQGGIKQNETPDQALFRELREEVGLSQKDVSVIAQTDGWLKYDLPKHMLGKRQPYHFVGQKQKWFLLRFNSQDSAINTSLSDSPEFDGWSWVDYWQPIDQVIFFKRAVYKQALTELKVYLDTNTL